MKPTNDPEFQSVPFDNIRTLFLIDDKDLFPDSKEGPQNPQVIRDSIVSIMCFAQCEERANAISMQSGATIHQTGALFVPNGGGYIAYALYEQNGKKSFALIAAEITTMTTANGTHPCFTANYLLCGDIQESAALNGEAEFTPDLVMCRAVIDDSGEERFLQADGSNEFYAALCYGRTLLKQLVAGEKIDLQMNQFWLNPPAIAIAGTELLYYLTVKTSAELKTEIAMDNLARQATSHPEVFSTRSPS